jgi:hypothetical protein
MRKITSVIVKVALLMGSIGVLIAYWAIVSDLPSRIYTQDQSAFLNYNYGRAINQTAPIWNQVKSDTQVVLEPSVVAEWEKETRVRAVLNARYEEHERVCVTLYDLDFHAEYLLAYPGPDPATTIELFFPFPSNLETLHDVRLLANGIEPPEAHYSLDGIRWQTEMKAGDAQKIEISYQADGVNSFTYALNHNRRANVLDVSITVLGLKGSELTKASLPITESTEDEDGQTFIWDYENLIPDRNIQIVLPARLGFAQRVAQLQGDFRTLAGLAPFLIVLFLASLAGMLYLNGVHLQWENYLLIGCALALFYPMLTFLSGLVNVGLAATITFLLVSGLLVYFLSLAAGWRNAGRYAALLLVIFLGLFSLGILTPWWKLLITFGGLLLVGIFMLLNARRPSTPKPSASPANDSIAPCLDPEISESKPASVPPSDEDSSTASKRHCPHCGYTLADDYAFCPGCGNDARLFRRCPTCGSEHYLPGEARLNYCPVCGNVMDAKPSSAQE